MSITQISDAAATANLSSGCWPWLPRRDNHFEPPEPSYGDGDPTGNGEVYDEQD